MNPIIKKNAMISVDDALAHIREQIAPLPPVVLPLEAAGGKVLAEDVRAQADIPAWPQSSMDGYAFAGAGLGGHASALERLLEPGHIPLELIVTGEIPAGTTPTFTLAPGHAARIFTGAMLPPGADTVVMQEKVLVSGDRIRIQDPTLQQGANVRPRGAELTAGALALTKGAVLGPAAIGLVAGLGLDKVPVIPLPRVSLITTGNELQTPGKPLGPGQVYESNSFALRAALEQTGVSPVTRYAAPDDQEALTRVIREAMETCDLLLLTGGVSVGAYDFVARALSDCGVRTVFHGVKQRPGKPLYFGMAGNRPVFGLPGNPSSVLTCFYIYVLQAIEQMSGRPTSRLRQERLPLETAYRKPAGLTHFLKGVATTGAAVSNTVTPLGAQESYRMSTYALADSLIRLPEAGTLFDAGDPVDVYHLP
jgi:molybdopterin molybdotransferase